jgi:hypothetical protein
VHLRVRSKPIAGEQGHFHTRRYGGSMIPVAQGQLVNTVSSRTSKSARFWPTYLENGPDACPRQSYVNRINTPYRVAYRLEFVDES